MKYCDYCGAELTEDMRFCGQCGRAVSEGEETPPRDYWAERLQHPQEPQEPAQPEKTEEKSRRVQPEKKKGQPRPAEEILLEEVLEEEANGTRRKLRIFRVLSLVLLGTVLVLGGILTAMAAIRREPAVRELYNGVACTVGGEQFSGTGDWAALQSDGKAELFLVGKGHKGTYTREEGQILISCGDILYTGKLQEGILTLEQGDMTFTLCREGLEMPPMYAGTSASGLGLTHWEGDYYGWWRVSQAWGIWEKTAGKAWDVCGRIWLEQPDQGKLELWDTDCRLGELFCAADVQITPGLTELGCLENGMGRFCDFELKPGDWVIDPAREPHKSAPGLLILRGSFQDGDSGFAYEVFLAPWGTQWGDMKKLPAGILPAEQKLPKHYKDWYEPLLRQNAQMPESFYDLETGKNEK